MDSPLSVIDAACFATLGTLHKEAGPPGPFAKVGRWAGQVTITSKGLVLDQAIVNQVPALLWQWEGETTEIRRQLDGEQEVVGHNQFVAWIVARDTRGPDKLVKGSTDKPGAQDLLDAVLGRLSALRIVDEAGRNLLLGNERLAYSGAKEHLAQQSHVIVYAARFDAIRSVPTATITAASRPLIGLKGDVFPPSLPNDERPFDEFQAPPP